MNQEDRRRDALELELRDRLKNSLSSTGHFYAPTNAAITPRSQFCEHLADQRVSKEIDPVALCEFPSHYAFFGTRTILRQIRRTDWYADDRLELLNTPVGVPGHGHGQRKMPAESVAEGFVELLLDETRARVRDCRRLGLLLSGGMDSRIVAAALAELQRSGWGFDVTCFTWGQPGTRDVVYAERIASHYGWAFEHFGIDAETLWQNVAETAANGCFYSAIHLHAMPAVARRAEDLGVELMLAGSYGDSVGRAEYGGRHVTKLPAIEHRFRNWYGLIDPVLFRTCRVQSARELARCRCQYGAKSKLAVIELDRQLHYMRNMLGSAMNVIDSRLPLAQAFTSQAIVEFMWSLAPESRTDEIYLLVLGQLEPELLEIPWARTGKPFLQSNSNADDLKRSFHLYSKWTRDNLDRLEQSIFSGSIERCGAFNVNAIRQLFWAFQKYPFVQSGRLLEIVLWLGSLGLLLDQLDAPSLKTPERPRRRRLWHRLELYGTLARQYQAYGRAPHKAQ